MPLSPRPINQTPFKGRNLLFKMERKKQPVCYLCIHLYGSSNKVMQSVVCWQKKNDSFLFQNQYTAFIRVCIFFSETPFKKKQKTGSWLVRVSMYRGAHKRPCVWGATVNDHNKHWLNTLSARLPAVFSSGLHNTHMKWGGLLFVVILQMRKEKRKLPETVRSFCQKYTSLTQNFMRVFLTWMSTPPPP